MTTREAVALALFAGGTAWNFGNAGPIVTPISEEFSASLGVVGLISGALYGALLLATATSPTLTKRMGAANGARAACALGGLGNVIFALAPTLGVALGGRVVAGYGVGITVVVGPAIARAMGGVRGVGVFGAAIMVGIGLALGVGGVLENAGVDWRIAVLLAGAISVLALPFLPRHVDVPRPGRREPGIALELLRSARLWRLSAVFLGTLGVSVTVGAWLIYYLSVEGDESTAVAGLLSFLVFAVAAVMRVVGGRLDHRGVPKSVLIGLTPLIAAAGIVTLAIEPTIEVAIPAAVMIGTGLALPYAAMFDEAQRLFPKRPVSAIAFASVGANGSPALLIPLLGVLFADGLLELSWLLLAAIVAIGGLANLRSGAAAGPRAGDPPREHSAQSSTSLDPAPSSAMAGNPPDPGPP